LAATRARSVRHGIHAVIAKSAVREHAVRRSRTSVTGSPIRTLWPDLCLTTMAANELGATQRFTRRSSCQFGTFPPRAGAAIIITAAAARTERRMRLR
jgi:hypothetical protein